MKISFLIPSLRPGGSERQYVLLAKSLHEHGYTINFVTYKEKNCFYNLDKIEHVHIPKKRKIDLKFLRSLIDYIKQNRIDILFSCYEGRFEAPLLWARLAKLFYPKLTLISGYRNTKLTITLIVIEKLTNHLASILVANNQQILKFYVNKLNIDEKKCRYISNIADKEHFFPHNQENRKKQRSFYFPGNENKFICGSLGSYSPQKNQRLIIRAAEYIQQKKEIYDMHFSLYGDTACVNSQFEKLKTQIKKNGLNSHVSLNSTIKEVNELMNSIDVLIISSLWEGMPNVAMEAMMCKKAVIISKTANAAGLVIEGINGLIYETNNYYHLADCILRIKKYPIEVSKSYLDDFHKKHDKKSIVNDYINCFKSICQ